MVALAVLTWQLYRHTARVPHYNINVCVTRGMGGA